MHYFEEKKSEEMRKQKTPFFHFDKRMSEHLRSAYKLATTELKTDSQFKSEKFR